MKSIKKNAHQAENYLKDIEEMIGLSDKLRSKDYKKGMMNLVKRYGAHIEKAHHPAINMLENLIGGFYEINHTEDIDYEVGEDIKEILDALNEAFAGCYDIYSWVWDDLPDFVAVQELMDKYEHPKMTYVSVEVVGGLNEQSDIQMSSHALVISDRGMAESTAMMLYEKWLSRQ